MLGGGGVIMLGGGGGGPVWRRVRSRGGVKSPTVFHAFLHEGGGFDD